MAKIYHTTGVSTLHHGGKLYQADASGEFEVPDADVHHLRSHGFAPAEERPKPDAKPKKGKADSSASDTALATSDAAITE